MIEDELKFVDLLLVDEFGLAILTAGLIIGRGGNAKF